MVSRRPAFACEKVFVATSCIKSFLQTQLTIKFTIKFTIYNLQFTIYNLQFTIYNLQFIVQNLPFTIFLYLFIIYHLTFSRLSFLQCNKLHPIFSSSLLPRPFNILTRPILHLIYFYYSIFLILTYFHLQLTYFSIL